MRRTERCRLVSSFVLVHDEGRRTKDEGRRKKHRGSSCMHACARSAACGTNQPPLAPSLPRKARALAMTMATTVWDDDDDPSTFVRLPPPCDDDDDDHPSTFVRRGVG